MMIRTGKILIYLAILLILTACQAAAPGATDDAGQLPEDSPEQAELPVAPAKDARAPGYETTDLAGNPVTLADYRGQVVLLNFWATWCTPCRDEMPVFQERFEELSPEFTVVAVNFDEPAAQIQPFVDELGLSFNIHLDPGGDIQLLYQVRGYPTSMFVDEEGVIRIVHVGAMSEEQLDGYLVEMGLTEGS